MLYLAGCVVRGGVAAGDPGANPLSLKPLTLNLSLSCPSLKPLLDPHSLS